MPLINKPTTAPTADKIAETADSSIPNNTAGDNNITNITIHAKIVENTELPP